MSLCSINLTIGVKKANKFFHVENNKINGLNGYLSDNLLVYKNQR